MLFSLFFLLYGCQTTIDLKTTTSTANTTTTVHPNMTPFGDIGMTPQIFAPGFISTVTDIEFAGTFSPNYEHFFFTRRVPDGDNRLFYSAFVAGAWTVPALSPISEDLPEFEPFITPSGDMLYFGSRRGGHDEPVIYQSAYLNGAWQAPVFVDNGLNDRFAMYISVSSSGNIYYTGGAGIYVKRFVDGEYQPSQLISIFGVHPYIAPDESYMLVDHEIGTSGYIYILFYEDGVWGDPIQLGEEVNQTDANHICASVTADGRYFFFSRFFEGGSDIYWVDAAYLDQYRE